MPAILNEHGAWFGPLADGYFLAQDFVMEQATRKHRGHQAEGGIEGGIVL